MNEIEFNSCRIGNIDHFVFCNSVRGLEKLIGGKLSLYKYGSP